MNNFIEVQELGQATIIDYLRDNEFDFEEYERLRSLFEDELMLRNNIEGDEMLFSDIEEGELYY